MRYSFFHLFNFLHRITSRRSTRQALVAGHRAKGRAAGRAAPAGTCSLDPIADLVRPDLVSARRRPPTLLTRFSAGAFARTVETRNTWKSLHSWLFCLEYGDMLKHFCSG
ncbi:hypothetical protein EVAR_63587_1 [Eumeta japonica]|uniref:Uncharacterized protein n=1 Tax=Eumeta variegata TaxID=151549 RepID=A0A4C1ZII9_EUMVA|nr:hypothetical protein EVAR_63587_1 [Eumeta japonica]